jgi:hypothetical protein
MKENEVTDSWLQSIDEQTMDMKSMLNKRKVKGVYSDSESSSDEDEQQKIGDDLKEEP